MPEHQRESPLLLNYTTKIQFFCERFECLTFQQLEAKKASIIRDMNTIQNSEIKHKFRNVIINIKISLSIIDYFIKQKQPVQ